MLLDVPICIFRNKLDVIPQLIEPRTGHFKIIYNYNLFIINFNKWNYIHNYNYIFSNFLSLPIFKSG